MAYLRKPDGEKRGKEKKSDSTPSKVAHLQMPTSPPVTVASSEDRASHDRHVKALQRECRSIRQNKLVCIMDYNPYYLPGGIVGVLFSLSFNCT